MRALKHFRLRMRVQKTGHTFLPTELREAGFEGEMDVLPNHFTALLVKPGSTPEEIQRSLKVHLSHIEMVMQDRDEVEV